MCVGTWVAVDAPHIEASYTRLVPRTLWPIPMYKNVYFLIRCFTVHVAIQLEQLSAIYLCTVLRPCYEAYSERTNLAIM